MSDACVDKLSEQLPPNRAVSLVQSLRRHRYSDGKHRADSYSNRTTTNRTSRDEISQSLCHFQRHALTKSHDEAELPLGSILISSRGQSLFTLNTNEQNGEHRCDPLVQGEQTIERCHFQWGAENDQKICLGEILSQRRRTHRQSSIIIVLPEQYRFDALTESWRKTFTEEDNVWIEEVEMSLNGGSHVNVPGLTTPLHSWQRGISSLKMISKEKDDTAKLPPW